jgi:hypothetical protein
MESYFKRLDENKQVVAKAIVHAIEELDNAGDIFDLNGLCDFDPIAGEIAETNAYGWGCYQASVTEFNAKFNIAATTLNSHELHRQACWDCVAKITAYFEGEQDPDKMPHGDNLRAELSLRFNNYDNKVGITVLSVVNVLEEQIEADRDREELEAERAAEERDAYYAEQEADELEAERAAEAPDDSGNDEDWGD